MGKGPREDRFLTSTFDHCRGSGSVNEPPLKVSGRMVGHGVRKDNPKLEVDQDYHHHSLFACSLDFRLVRLFRLPSLQSHGNSLPARVKSRCVRFSTPIDRNSRLSSTVLICFEFIPPFLSFCLAGDWSDPSQQGTDTP